MEVLKILHAKKKTYFKETISQYKIRLWEWVILGKHARSSSNQEVNAIIMNDELYTFEDFRESLSKSSTGFGTGLSWTRQF